MATYVLVHGAGHGGWCYGPLAAILQAHGHAVFTPTMTGLGERRHLMSVDVGLETHITDVLSLLEYENLNEVILVGHSYGGTIITGVADRAIDRVAHLVFLDAPLPENGRSMAEIIPYFMETSRAAGQIVDGVELVMIPGLHPRGFHGVTDPDDMAWMATRLTPHPWKAFEDRLHLANEAAVDRLPHTWISCGELISAMAREAMEAIPHGRLFEIESGHDVMIIKPQAVADILLPLAS